MWRMCGRRQATCNVAGGAGPCGRGRRPPFARRFPSRASRGSSPSPPAISACSVPSGNLAVFLFLFREFLHFFYYVQHMLPLALGRKQNSRGTKKFPVPSIDPIELLMWFSRSRTGSSLVIVLEYRVGHTMTAQCEAAKV